MQTPQQSVMVLLRLHEQRHPSHREKILQQILDEYQFLRDNILANNNLSTNVLVQLSEHLREELTKNLVVIPPPPKQAGIKEIDLEELKNTKIRQSLDNLKSCQNDATVQKKEFQTLLEPLLLQESAAEILNSSDAFQVIVDLLSDPPQPLFIHFLASVSSFCVNYILIR